MPLAVAIPRGIGASRELQALPALGKKSSLLPSRGMTGAGVQSFGEPCGLPACAGDGSPAYGTYGPQPCRCRWCMRPRPAPQGHQQLSFWCPGGTGRLGKWHGCPHGCPLYVCAQLAGGTGPAPCRGGEHQKLILGAEALRHRAASCRRAHTISLWLGVQEGKEVKGGTGFYSPHKHQQDPVSRSHLGPM